MSNLLIAADVGNSVASLGLFRNSRLLAKESIPVEQLPLRGNPSAQLSRRFVQKITDTPAIVIGSVNPAATRHLEARFRRELPGCKPLLIGRDGQVPVANRVQRPDEVGADRLLNTLAAYHKTGEQTIVVDYGTCIVFDIIASDGAFIGGIITPGHTLIARALAAGTQLLPEVITTRKPKRIGRSTVGAIQAGTFYGIVGTVNGILHELSDELGPSRIVATGGHAGRFARQSPTIESVLPNLTLEGVRLTYRAWMA